ncbi:hypothetical protein BO94DRAFT_557985 [Aspergillus sclerotioniger CBS 115572]|uniref:DUF7136 domain-containing protein n=1 Tax=Aspergillus sclerotioniger CBS 115572 TaxID=1450535 RepID=A0A317W4I8_9EURO|nr:hypothetical protein BO94DRAFT_557985 [Aspergillus sclerotioniger CBS 115572]PWY81536.1 hypothetical protein BO94DRAFT_557985 [Aspergillus sclerotioniger CBS 115572]
MHFPQARWLGLLGVMVTVTTADTVEVDLIFPHNESYAPADWFPIVFVVQNTQSAELLNLRISYDIRWNNDVNNQSIFAHDFRWTNWSGSADPYLAYHYLRWQSCDEEYLSRPSIYYGRNGIFNHHYSGWQFFSIEDAPLKDVDLVAATANATCPGDCNAIAINVTDITMNTFWNMNTAGRDTCVVTTNSTASHTYSTPDPCRIAIDADSAASMASVHHTRLCDGLNPPDDCPKRENGAQKLEAWGMSCFLAAFGVTGAMLL